MTSLYLTRMSLKDTPDVSALRPMLLPSDEDDALASDHRLIWSAFANGDGEGDADGEKRRFLWRRQDASGRYLALSAIPPAHSNALFDVETKPFEPSLSPGDRFSFVLRVNATVDRRGAGRSGGRVRSDVAMDLLRSTPRRARAAARQKIAQDGATAWIEARAAADGFTLEALQLEGYRAARAPRRGKPPAAFGVFDLAGLLTVVEPSVFLTRLASGFGRAKAFGCGLMLIRRAPVS